VEEVSVLGFDRSTRSWVMGPSDVAASVPELDGRLLVDEASLADGGDDFGHIRHLMPIAVLDPATEEDVLRIVRFARENGIKVAARGRGHSTFGQSQAEGGIVIRMASLKTPPLFDGDAVWVNAGMSWMQVLDATFKRGLRPPVLTQTTELSVGGTLSVAGIDGGSYRYGAQIDNVLALRVVTGEGELETCSETEKPDLFNAVLAGMGQCGIIVSAKMRLIPADSHARIFRMFYPDLSSQLRDLRRLIADGRFDRIQGRIDPEPAPATGWRYYLVGGRNYTPPDMPDDASLLNGLGFIKERLEVRDSSYLGYADRRLQFAAARAAGIWNSPQPWFQSIVPDSVSDQFMSEIVSQVAADQIGYDGPIEIFALWTKKLTRPLCRFPDEPIIFGFGCPTRAPDAETALKMVERNRRFYDRSRELGCMIYPICSTEIKPEEFREQYGPHWEAFAAAKRRYDPDKIMGPGPAIFA
jgi:cytokinin dehydrogenase